MQSEPENESNPGHASIAKYKTFLQGSEAKPQNGLISQSPLLPTLLQELPSPIGLDQLKTPAKRRPTQNENSGYTTPILEEYWASKLKEIRNRLESRDGFSVSASVAKSIEKAIVKGNPVGAYNVAKRKISEMPELEGEDTSSKRSKSMAKSWLVSESPIIDILGGEAGLELETPITLRRLDMCKRSGII